jgi:hypothetical protein
MRIVIFKTFRQVLFQKKPTHVTKELHVTMLFAGRWASKERVICGKTIPQVLCFDINLVNQGVRSHI